MSDISFGPRFPASAASDGGNIDLTGDHSREPDYDYVQRGTVESLRARIAALEAERDAALKREANAIERMRRAETNANDDHADWLALDAKLAASEQRAAALAAIGQRLYGQAMTFAIQFHQREGHAGLWADDKCGVGVCRSTLRQVTEWEALAAAAPSDHECRVMTRSIPALCVVCAKPKEAAAPSAGAEGE